MMVIFGHLFRLLRRWSQCHSFSDSEKLWKDYRDWLARLGEKVLSLVNSIIIGESNVRFPNVIFEASELTWNVFSKYLELSRFRSCDERQTLSMHSERSDHLKETCDRERHWLLQRKEKHFPCDRIEHVLKWSFYLSIMKVLKKKEGYASDVTSIISVNEVEGRRPNKRWRVKWSDFEKE